MSTSKRSHGRRYVARTLGRKSTDQFAARLKAALKQTSLLHEITYDRRNYRLAFSNRGNPTKYSYLRLKCKEHFERAGEERPQHLQRVARDILCNLMELPRELPEALPNIQVAIRTPITVDCAGLQSEPGTEGMPVVPVQRLGDHLGAYVVYHQLGATRYLSLGDLERWGITLQQAVDIGMRNLTDSGVRYKAVDGRIHVSESHDSLGSSSLLNLDLIRQLDVRGRPIAMAPHQDVSFVTGEDDLEGQAFLLDSFENRISQSNRLCCIPLVLNGDHWMTWSPAADHPMRARFRILEEYQLFHDYDVQTERMKMLLDSEFADKCWPPYHMIPDPHTGEMTSGTLWFKNVEMLLPKASCIMLGDREKDEILAIGSWERVKGVVGHLMEPTDLSPSRVLVRQFPTSEQLRQIDPESFE